MPPVKPMLAKAAERIPPGMSYEAKWDGFRAIVHRDGDEIEIGSRSGKSLTRYFPEVVDALRARLPERCVLDGEIVIVRDGAAGLRRPAGADPSGRLPGADAGRGDAGVLRRLRRAGAGRRRRCSTRRCGSGARCWSTRWPGRPTRSSSHRPPPIRRSPQEWFRRYEGAGLDGVVAKPPDLPYRPGERLMVKIKHERTADCVLAGFRYHKSGPVVGSLLLGLYDAAGRLQHVGVCASFPMRRREELLTELEPLRMPSVEGHPWAAWADEEAHASDRMPGAPSRWSGGKDLSWMPLRPERVVEVAYDHMQGDRFRHTARFRRWRPDRDPGSCTYAQLEEPVGYDLADVLGPPPAS